MFEWNEDELAIRDAVRSFVDKEIRPLQDDLEHGDLPPYEVIRKYYRAFGIGEDNITAFEASFEADHVPAPIDRTPGVIANIELTKVSMGISAAMGVSNLCAGTINALGSAEQRRRWVPDLLRFDKVGAWAITEPDSGSDAFGGMRSTVKRDGEDYVLSGQKTFITNGPYADTLVVYAKYDDGSGIDKRDQPVKIFVLDQGMEGLTQSKPFRKMGLHSSPTGELAFDGVRLTADRELVGTQGSDGRASARTNFVLERLGIASLALGVIEECQRLCVDYAKSRELWGKPIGDFQLIQLKLANMEIARVNVTNMVHKGIHGFRTGNLPDMAEASAVKLYSSTAATEVAMEAVQLFGGNGYMSEYRVEQLARDAKSLMIYAGSNEVQVTHVAKGVLRR